MDQLRALRTFAQVAEQGGFAAAARALNLAPSVVTRQVAELEQQLGARLLTRTTRRVALTPIGQQYLQRVHGVLQELDDAAAGVAESQQGLRGRVRLAATPLFAARQLVPRLPRLHAQHPGLAVDLSASGPLDTLHEAHDISLVVRRDALDGEFVAHALARSRVLLCASPAYLRRCGPVQHPRELHRHALLITTLARMPRVFQMTQAHTGCTAEVAPGHVAMSSPNGELVCAAALSGLGIAALPSFAVQDELQQGRLQVLLADWQLFDLALYACLPSRRQVPAVVRTLLDFLRAEFPDARCDPWWPKPAEAPAHLRLAA